MRYAFALWLLALAHHRRTCCGRHHAGGRRWLRRGGIVVARGPPGRGRAADGAGPDGRTPTRRRANSWPHPSMSAAASTNTAERPGPPSSSGAGHRLVFVNFADQRLYARGRPRRHPGSADPGQRRGRRGSGNCASPRSSPGPPGHVLAICEDHRTELRRYIAAIPLDGSAAEDPGALIEVTASSRFVAAPRLNPSGTRISWISWEHPQMPWDGTQLHVADLRDLAADNDTVLAGSTTESVLQPEWLDDRPARVHLRPQRLVEPVPARSGLLDPAPAVRAGKRNSPDRYGPWARVGTRSWMPTPCFSPTAPMAARWPRWMFPAASCSSSCCPSPASRPPACAATNCWPPPPRWWRATGCG